MNRLFFFLAFCISLSVIIVPKELVAFMQTEQGSTLLSDPVIYHKHKMDEDCTSCHNMLNEYPTYTELSSKKCDECHQDGFSRSSVIDWTHPLQDAAVVETECTGCHAIDTEGDIQKIDDVDALCIDCHGDTRNDFRLLSHHPLNEGLIKCSECHGVHRERAMSLTVSDLDFLGTLAFEWHDPLTQNASCLRCHSWFSLTSLTGSEFVIANAENLHFVHCEEGFIACTECHIPHGSFAPKLIKERLPEGKTLLFNRGLGCGTCSTTCHSQSHIQVSYGSDPQMIASP